MRPLKLEVEGFTAFKEHLDLDLTSLDLFAITGPTGAGKSSLIDAICYALYGRVPRVASEIKECISLGLNRMYVSLEFLAGQTTYRVFREAKRQGQPNVRLERCLDGEWQALAQGATEVTRRLEAVVGLNYDAFTRSVLLPQGQFQEFLSGSPDKRRDVLQSLLRLDVYKRMQAGANEMASAYKQKAEGIERELNEYLSEATPDNLAKQIENHHLARSENESLTGQIDRWRDAVDQAKAYATLLDAFRKARDERQQTAADLESANAVLAEGDGELRGLADNLEKVEATLALNAYDDELFAALSAASTIAATLETARKRLLEAESQAEAAGAALDSATATARTASATLGGANSELEEMERQHNQALHGNMAAAVQAGLRPGDPCPVCGGKAGRLPAIDAADLDGAKRGWEAARQRQSRAQHDLSTAEATRSAAEATGKAVVERLAQYQSQAGGEESRLDAVMPADTPRTVEAIQTLLHGQKTAREERLTFTRRHEEVKAALNASHTRFSEAREKVGGLQMLLDTQDERLKAATAATSEAHAALKTLAEEQHLDAVAQALASRTDAVTAAQGTLLELSARKEAVQKEIGRLDAIIDKLKDDIDKAEQLRKVLIEVRAGQDVAGDLSQMLMANRFQAFMQSEALHVLAAQGSDRLERLSSGRYRLDISTNGQDFEAIDQWNADDKRSVRTLSGGETFLASMALALALAESLPGLAPDSRVALDAIFLDEGFGSLDPEALDRASEALDSLRDGTRMVCVVTHLPELAQRMPARIVVEKSEAGSRAAIAT